MALALANNSKGFATPSTTSRRPNKVSTCSARRSVVVPVVAKASTDAPSPVSTVVSAFAASLVLLSSTPALAAKYEPAATTSTRGKDETEKLVQQGTPGAARPTPMQTNIPFQAPGVSGSPRGAGQDQGTNVKTVLRDAGRQIKDNRKNPDQVPFGIHKPLVRSAQKMSQPGSINQVKEAPTTVFAEASSLKKDKENANLNAVPRGYYRLYDKMAGKGSTESKFRGN